MAFRELCSGRTCKLVPPATETLSSHPTDLVHQIPNKWCCHNFSILSAVSANSWPVCYPHRISLIPLNYWAKILQKCCLNPSWTDAINKEELLALYFRLKLHDITTIQKPVLFCDINRWFIITFLQLPNSVSFHFFLHTVSPSCLNSLCQCVI